MHGCIDGFSMRIVFLSCSNNNLSPTVLEPSLAAVDKDRFWPLRIGVDCEMQNVLVCDAKAEPVFW